MDDDPIGIPNNPPFTIISGKTIYEATSINGAEINLDASKSYDPDDGDSIESYKWETSFSGLAGESSSFDPILPLGEHNITLVVNDGELDSIPVTVTVKVQDTTPPVLNIPEDFVVEAKDILTPLDIGEASATDIFPVTITNDAPAKFPLGITTVNWTAKDSNGLETTKPQYVTIQDTIPPEISVTVSPNKLWPLNHKMVNISASIEVKDIFPTTVVLTSIESNEADNGQGDSNTTNDIQEADIGTEDYLFLLRAERSGKGNDRIYTITYTVKDSSENVSNALVTVTVPQNQGKKKWNK